MAVKCFIRIACAVLSSSALLLLNSCAASSTSPAPAARETAPTAAASVQETTPPVAEVAGGTLTITGFTEFTFGDDVGTWGAGVTAEFEFDEREEISDTTWKGRYLIAAESVTAGIEGPVITPAKIKDGSVTLPVWELNITYDFNAEAIIEQTITRYSGNDAVNLHIIQWSGEEDIPVWMSVPGVAPRLDDSRDGLAQVKFDNGSATAVFVVPED